ncbi:MAG TPA: tetratricopeptide repeat protein [Casimicrobiaceae bacterium]|nr:tetratricopeptide repeat protein [Casimicrobiaceae bacterium]
MAASYDDWISRAREHIAEARPIDALTCYREAARLGPGTAEPLRGMADSLWRLGKTREAVAAWREAVTRQVDDLPSWQALAEASIFVGDDALAQEAARHVRAGESGNRFARFIEACHELASPQTRATACAALEAIVVSKLRFIRRPHVAGALARALAAIDQDECQGLRRALAAHAASLPFDLMPAVAPLAAADVLRARIDSASVTDDLDALRRVALAMGRDELGQRAADRYSRLCMQKFEPDVSLGWPRRTAGERLRVIVIADAYDATEAHAAHDDRLSPLLAALQRMSEHVELSVGTFGAGQPMVDRLASTSLTATRVAQMPDAPDVESARALAAADPDVLIDLCGIARPMGPLLAARPARLVLSTADAPHLAMPLVDDLVANEPGAWHDILAGMFAAMAGSASANSGADALRTTLEQAIAAHREGRLDAAAASYGDVLAEQPAHASTLHLRGALHRDAGNQALAQADFTAALAVAPRDRRSRVALAQLALAEHRAGDARRLMEAGLELDPADLPMLRTLGHAALAQRDAAAAVNAFAAALAAEPFDAETHFNHGVALQMLRYLGDAARAYRRALDIMPSLVDAHFNLGIVFDQLDEADPAITALEYVLKRQPQRADAHRALLDILSRRNRGSEWMRAFLRFEASCPDALGLVANALEYYQYMGDFARVQTYVERLSRDEFKPANELDLVDSLEQLLYLMLFFDIDPGVQASLYSTYDKAVNRVYGQPWPPRPARAPGVLRVGYLSADMRDHVMGKMMLPVLREHDRGQFSIFLYSTSESEDEVTAQFRQLGDPFVTLHGLADDAAASRIAEDDLDILVDLSTHTRGARPGIVARKAARVQITHVASAGLLGMSAVDFKITDHFADLPESDDLLIESLLPMDGCAYPVRRMQAAQDHAFHRQALGIPADAVVIGAFVTPLKLSRRTMALWKEILDRVPLARIAFSPSAPWLGDSYPRILAAAGIDPGRALILPQGRNEAEGLARYAIVDFVLDPAPFGNVNGTIEPLNLGIPVVTLCGRSHGARTGFSILSNLGVTSTIATSGREYVAIAVRLADDMDFRGQVRREIEHRLADSPLFDMRDYARRLEAVYREAMRRAGLAPEP